MIQNTPWWLFMDSAIVKKVRRGTTLFRVLFVLALSMAAIAWKLGEAAWAASAFNWALAFGFIAQHLRNKLMMAIWLSMNPEDVFWVHPADQNGLVIDQQFETCRKVVLHAKSGFSLEITLDQQERSQLDEWRKSTGASVRWGSWDETKVTNHASPQH